ncbi:type IV secretory system conjugative DNA transfer family protein, partial [Rhodospirillum sp. A1_3_36]|uniref:type IV secretory system conjugative DNA transfer family protein n=1 Tax=Rhodospirillum sp. A1_3_36 TaxID=3391666 RepID=UPI0039A42B3D
LKNSPEGETVTLASVLYRLNHFDAHAGGTETDRFIVENTLNDPATFDDYKGFTNAAPEKMMLSFVSTAATALSLLGNPDIARLTSHHDFDFAAMKEEETALFVMVRQQDMGTFRFLLSLFYTELCSALLKERKGRLPVFLLLDEFAHLRIPGFPTFAATARKYRVGFWLILQSLSQLSANYGQNEASAILESVGTESYFGGMGLDTAQNLSARLGTAFRLNWFKPSDGLHQSPLMRPDQLIRLRDNELLVLHGNRDPLRLRSLPYYRRSDLRTRARMLPAELPETRGTSP